MVKETKIVFGLGDLSGMRLKCEHCSGQLLCDVSPDAPDIPHTCPWCNRDWRVGAARTVLNALKRALQAETPTTGIQLEMEEEKP